MRSWIRGQRGLPALQRLVQRRNLIVLFPLLNGLLDCVFLTFFLPFICDSFDFSLEFWHLSQFLLLDLSSSFPTRYFPSIQLRSKERRRSRFHVFVRIIGVSLLKFLDINCAQFWLEGWKAGLILIGWSILGPFTGKLLELQLIDLKRWVFTHF